MISLCLFLLPVFRFSRSATSIASSSTGPMGDPLAARRTLTDALQDRPYSLLLYLERAQVYDGLGYPDLAVMDVYKALTLADEVVDEYAEYHEQAFASAAEWFYDDAARCRLSQALQLQPRLHLPELHRQQDLEPPLQISDSTSSDVQSFITGNVVGQASTLLAHHLASIGCLRSAYDYLQNTLKHESSSITAEAERKRILVLAKAYVKSRNEPWDGVNVNVDALPDRGFVRREVYPWNIFERNRMSQESLRSLNTALSSVAPKLEVKATRLPVLSISQAQDTNNMSLQLGVFAKADIEPGELILRERSLLTANARLHEPLCDACSASLPTLAGLDTAHPEDGQVGLLSCPDCDDTVFCSQQCLDLAQVSYHASICGADIDNIAKDVPTSQAVDALYTQLLLRALAMCYTQDKHPLDLLEVKYIWGDFSVPVDSAYPNSEALFEEAPRTLPFDFRSQVLQPLHFLELLDINIFEAPHGMAETWVYNTLFAKFRGTASARISPRDGRPEVAAVHPLWCLANHSCDPNVEWEWAGEITFTAKKERVRWRRGADRGVIEAEMPVRKGGVRSGEEILSHYVDVDLNVGDRRDWGVGALGGCCQCERCKWEAGEHS